MPPTLATVMISSYPCLSFQPPSPTAIATSILTYLTLPCSISSPLLRACSNNGCNRNGKTELLGGCGIVFTCKVWGRGVAHPFVNDGITHTGSCAELLAMIMVLKGRFLLGQGFESIMIATDSKYVVLGLQNRVQKWIGKGWRIAAGSTAANQDLRKTLLEELRGFEKTGSHARFWQISREWNEADKYAKKAAMADNSGTGGSNDFYWLNI